LEEGMTESPFVERAEERTSGTRRATTDKVSFKTGGAFLRDTRAEVEQHLAVGHVRLRAAFALYAKAPVAVGLIALSWAVLLFLRPDAVGVALCIAGLAVGAILVAFCVQHDANHGSTFKNPPGHKAWQLIDAAGCRGLVVGGAQVSQLHCNFLINLGNATAADIEALGEEVRRRVKDTSGVTLEWEIKRIGM